MTSPDFDPHAMAQIRFDNVMLLFDEYVAENVRNPDVIALRGLERRFAEQVLIQPSYWSQIKSRSRQIGERLARQFEQRCRKPPGWMDEAHDAGDTPRVAAQLPADDMPPDTSSMPRNDDERFIVGLVLSYYRRHPQRARARLLDLLGEVLAPPPLAPRPTVAKDASADELWRHSQKGVAPLKPRR